MKTALDILRDLIRENHERPTHGWIDERCQRAQDQVLQEAMKRILMGSEDSGAAE